MRPRAPFGNLTDAGTVRILIVSNGHGEDALGTTLARTLADTLGKRASLLAFPLVGAGRPYQAAGLPMVGVQQPMPSGGITRNGMKALVRDVGAGLFGLTWRQAAALRQLRGDVAMAITVGDVFPLWLCLRNLQVPIAHVPTAKSDHIRPHFPWEVRLMRRHQVVAVFPRDERTTRGLAAKGVRAHFCGNLMMDGLQASGKPLPLRDPIVVLPGSRDEAYANLRALLQASAYLTPQQFAVPLAPGLRADKAIESLRPDGWHPASGADPAVPGLQARLKRQGHFLWLFAGRFHDLLHAALLVVGTTGTGNEQAAGLGKAVIACPGQGVQFTPRILATQKRLLGDALHVVDSKPQRLAAAIERIAGDPELRRRMGEEGRRRMGGPGAAACIARHLRSYVGEAR